MTQVNACFVRAAHTARMTRIPLPSCHSSAPPAVSLRQLLQAPHRLMFFIGAGNLLLAMLWWASWLASQYSGAWPMPETPIYAGWLHALVMQYMVLPSFIFGFLLTVFPRWTGQPDLPRWRYLPVGAGLMGGQLAVLLSTLGWSAGLVVGVILALGGWSAALGTLAQVLRRDQGPTWHARSCYAALLLGWLGLALYLGFLLTGNAMLAFASIKMGGMGMLLPIYLSVAHRMFPFFAGNAIPGYRPWRPLPWLAGVWAAAMLHLGLELVHAYAWLWLPDLTLLALTGYALWRWWPRARMPGLLAVLFFGTAWMPITFALYSVQSLVYLATGEFVLGRAPMHAMFIGFFGSVLVAMVTRVTQGHSGRPLAMSRSAWFAFIALQGVAVMRVVAELVPGGMLLQCVAAVAWLVALAPWVSRIGSIYLSPRADGRPG